MKVQTLLFFRNFTFRKSAYCQGISPKRHLFICFLVILWGGRNPRAGNGCRRPTWTPATTAALWAVGAPPLHRPLAPSSLVGGARGRGRGVVVCVERHLNIFEPKDSKDDPPPPSLPALCILTCTPGSPPSPLPLPVVVVTTTATSDHHHLCH